MHMPYIHPRMVGHICKQLYCDFNFYLVIWSVHVVL